MFGIVRSQQARQSLHLLSCSAAGHVFSDVTTVDVQGQNVAAFPSTLWAESRIIKFFGTSSACIHPIMEASLVGNQCLIEGVSLQTSNIFFK